MNNCNYTDVITMETTKVVKLTLHEKTSPFVHIAEFQNGLQLFL